MFPGKAGGVLVGTRIPPDLSHLMDPNIADWLALTKQGVLFAVSDNITYPTTSVANTGSGSKRNTVTDVAIRKETIDFTDSAAVDSWWSERECVKSDDEEFKLQGFDHYSMENCRLSNVQVTITLWKIAGCAMRIFGLQFKKRLPGG